MNRIIADFALPVATLAAPCPGWCTVEHGEPFVDPVDGSQLIEHRATVLDDAGGHHVELIQSVNVAVDGSLDVEPVRVVVDEQLDDARTVEQTRAFLAGLALAAALADGSTR